ncbi:hypothetical protein Tco_1474816 [Tanacetum coccineum]
MATLEFSIKHNMVAFLQKPSGSEESHQIFWQTVIVEIVNNGEQQLSVTIDGQTIALTKASVRRHLQLVDADGISSLPNTEIFEQLTLMGYVSNDDKLTFQKGVHIPLFDSMLVHDQPGQDEGPSSPGKPRQEQEEWALGYPSLMFHQVLQMRPLSRRCMMDWPSSLRTSPEGGLGCHFTIGDIHVQARPERVTNLPNEPPLREGNTSRSGEGSMQLLELINLCTKLSNKVTSLEYEFASTKAVYNKALITLTKRGGMIEEIDNDETVNLVKSRELGKSHDTAKHKMESEHDDDDRNLSETLLNIQRSAAKAQILQDEVYAKQVEAQWIADEERIPQEAKQTDEREKVTNWNDPDVLSHFKGMSYEDIRPIFERVWDQNQAFIPNNSEIEKEVMKRPGFDLQQSSKKTEGSRKKTLSRKRAGEKQSKEDGGLKNYKIFSEMLDDFDRKDVMDLHRPVEERKDSLLRVVISALLKDDENKRLVSVLKKHKEAFSWKTFDIPGISPYFCKPKINFEDNAKLVIQRQHRLNPIMKEVIKKEIIKLFDAGIIYPIKDSHWEKCHFMVTEGIVLGHNVSSAGLEVDKTKINVITKHPPPTNVKSVRSFLGHAGFYH